MLHWCQAARLQGRDVKFYISLGSNVITVNDSTRILRILVPFIINSGIHLSSRNCVVSTKVVRNNILSANGLDNRRYSINLRMGSSQYTWTRLKHFSKSIFISSMASHFQHICQAHMRFGSRMWSISLSKQKFWGSSPRHYQQKYNLPPYNVKYKWH